MPKCKYTNCNKEFVTTHPSKVYCSRACKHNGMCSRTRRDFRRRWNREYGTNIDAKGIFEKKFLAQNGNCCICGASASKDKNLVIDHCHKSLIIRGLLCNSCNLGLGMFRDNVQFLKSAITYLEAFQ